ncbi:MAG TPA: hypothetical protein VGK93_05870 [Candidatus Eisenbacteria bacterium]|jgi:hypothetical protein
MSAVPPPSNPVGRPIERRRRTRGAFDRLLTAPIALPALEARGRRALRAVAPWAKRLALPLAVLALAYPAFLLWSSQRPPLAPRHRAEALCFALAQRPVFSPPMTVESSSALVRGRFHERTPAAVALRETMRFSDDMVIQEGVAHVGDYEVYRLWLRLPADRGSGHWLIVAWMEGADLAISSFHFAGDQPDPSPDELMWGEALLSRVLVRENFRSALPPVRVRLARADAPLDFGPKKRGD